MSRQIMGAGGRGIWSVTREATVAEGVSNGQVFSQFYILANKGSGDTDLSLLSGNTPDTVKFSCYKQPVSASNFELTQK